MLSDSENFQSAIHPVFMPLDSVSKSKMLVKSNFQPHGIVSTFIDNKFPILSIAAATPVFGADGMDVDFSIAPNPGPKIPTQTENRISGQEILEMPTDRQHATGEPPTTAPQSVCNQTRWEGVGGQYFLGKIQKTWINPRKFVPLPLLPSHCAAQSYHLATVQPLC